MNISKSGGHVGTKVTLAPVLNNDMQIPLSPSHPHSLRNGHICMKDAQTFEKSIF